MKAEEVADAISDACASGQGSVDYKQPWPEWKRQLVQTIVDKLTQQERRDVWRYVSDKFEVGPDTEGGGQWPEWEKLAILKMLEAV